jgi:LPS-assembly lipoprotein
MHRRSLLLMLIVLPLAGCGFQLRGAAGLPEVFQATWLEVPDRYSEFNDALREQLAASGAVFVTDPSAARVSVQVKRDEVGVRVLSVSARNTPREYEVVYSVIVTAAAGGHEILAAEPMTLTRNYAFSEAEVLVKDAEDRDIRRALAAELASLVAYRLAAAARNPPPAVVPPVAAAQPAAALPESAETPAAATAPSGSPAALLSPPGP